MAPVLLVDGHAYAYRAFHAIRGLRSADGRPTGAIFGFVKMVGRLAALTQPGHMAVVWDGGLSPERAALMPEYKAQRPPMPDDLEHQIDELMSYLPDAGIASVQQDEVEADDLIATIATSAESTGMRVIVASSDKDFFQLVTGRLGLINPGDKSEEIWGESRVVEKTGVRPDQIVDWLSLIGDSVDNISGVPGVGVKTATELLQQFQSVDELYARLAEVGRPRIREALRTAEGVVRRNQRMIALRRDLSGAPQLADLELRPAVKSALARRYRAWGFRTLAAEAESTVRSQGDLFGT